MFSAKLSIVAAGLLAGSPSVDAIKIRKMIVGSQDSQENLFDSQGYPLYKASPAMASSLTSDNFYKFIGHLSTDTTSKEKKTGEHFSQPGTSDFTFSKDSRSTTDVIKDGLGRRMMNTLGYISSELNNSGPEPRTDKLNIVVDSLFSPPITGGFLHRQLNNTNTQVRVDYLKMIKGIYMEVSGDFKHNIPYWRNLESAADKACYEAYKGLLEKSQHFRYMVEDLKKELKHNMRANSAPGPW